MKVAAQQASEDALSMLTCAADETPDGQIKMSLRQDCVELRNALAMHVGIYACQALAHFWPDGRSVLQDMLSVHECMHNVYVHYLALHHDGASSSAYWAAAAVSHHGVVQCGIERERRRLFLTVHARKYGALEPQKLWLHLEPLACCFHK